MTRRKEARGKRVKTKDGAPIRSRPSVSPSIHPLLHPLVCHSLRPSHCPSISIGCPPIPRPSHRSPSVSVCLLRLFLSLSICPSISPLIFPPVQLFLVPPSSTPDSVPPSLSPPSLDSSVLPSVRPSVTRTTVDEER